MCKNTWFIQLRFIHLQLNLHYISSSHASVNAKLFDYFIHHATNFTILSDVVYVIIWISLNYLSSPHHASFGYGMPSYVTSPLSSGDNVIQQAITASFTKPVGSESVSYPELDSTNHITHGVPPPYDSKPYMGASTREVGNGSYLDITNIRTYVFNTSSKSIVLSNMFYTMLLES